MTEELLRKNFVLVYEIIDEIIDWGYPQLTSADLIKPFIVSEPIKLPIQELSMPFNPSIFGPQTMPSIATNQPISFDQNKNEIYVDVLEKLTVLFNPNGHILNSSIDGCVLMKCYISGNPEIKITLNDEVVVGKNEAKPSLSSVLIEDVNFHESVNTKDFISNKSLALTAAECETNIMNYRINSEFIPPFRIYPFIDEINDHKLQVLIKIKANFTEEHLAGYLTIKFPVPRLTD